LGLRVQEAAGKDVEVVGFAVGFDGVASIITTLSTATNRISTGLEIEI
jgi:hypothetical protein